MEEWAVLTPAAKNQKFNACDSCAFAFEGFWPRLAGWYGLEWQGPQDDARYQTRDMPHNPRGYGGKAVVRTAFTLTNWVKQVEVQTAWKKLAEEHNLSQKELVDVDRVFGFIDGSLCRASPLMFR